MFQDLDSTLKAVIQDPLAPVQLRNANVTFTTPDKNFAPQAATINLFLYDVRENRELRDPVPIVEKQGDQFVRRMPPLRVECCYMITAWSTQINEAKVVEEHLLLSLTLAWLGRFATLPENRLQGSMVTQPFRIPVDVAQGDPQKQPHDLWYSLGVSPRAVVNLRSTIALDVGVDIEGPLVTTKTATVDPSGGGAVDQLLQIGGLVTRAGTNPAEPIAGATVDLDGAALIVTTDAAGRYAFLQVTAGPHTLRATAPGFQQVVRNNVIIPALPEEYNFELIPI
jgi:hypothetical protein